MTNFHKQLLFLLCLFLGNGIKNKSPMRPVDNYPPSSEKKTYQIKPLYDAQE